MSDDLRERVARARRNLDHGEEFTAADLRAILDDHARLTAAPAEFAAMLAVHCNGGDWNTDYTEDQRKIWRDRAERLRKDPSAIEHAPQEPEKYTIGDLTMDRVFRAAGLTNVSDMQAVFDQVEVALRQAIEPAPVSVREAARVLLDEWMTAKIPSATMTLFLQGQPRAGLRAIAEGKE